MREHVEPISKTSQTVDIKTSQPAILRWLSHIIGMVVMLSHVYSFVMLSA